MKLDSVKLRKLREKCRLSQAELATHLNLSQATICEWEKADSDVKLEYILKLGEVFQSEISELTKDGVSIHMNNQTNHRVGTNGVTDVSMESYHLQKDLIDSLKKQLAFLEAEVIRLKGGN